MSHPTSMLCPWHALHNRRQQQAAMQMEASLEWHISSSRRVALLWRHLCSGGGCGRLRGGSALCSLPLSRRARLVLIDVVSLCRQTRALQLTPGDTDPLMLLYVATLQKECAHVMSQACGAPVLCSARSAARPAQAPPLAVRAALPYRPVVI